MDEHLEDTKQFRWTNLIIGGIILGIFVAVGTPVYLKFQAGAKHSEAVAYH